MRILIIIPHFWPELAGAEVFAKNIAEFLVKKGNKVDLLTGQWQDTWSGQEVVSGVKIKRVKPWINLQFFKTFGIFFPLYFKALQLIKGGRYDLVHCHIFPTNIIGGLLKLKTKTPIIITVQGGDIADYKENFGPIPQVFEPLISWSLKKANVVHVVSHNLEDKVKEMGVDKIKLVPNGVDTKIFNRKNKKFLRKKFNIPQNKFVIISTSRLTYKNGLDILIKSINALEDKKDILLLLVGRGYFQENLEKLVKKLNLGDKVKFLGYKNQKEISQLLSISDIFCRPSRQEGFGISFLEAMAVGIPVIGTKVGGITDFVKEGINGLLVSPENINSLTKTIELLYKDKNLRRQIGENNRKQIYQDYNWRNIYNKLENLYKEILARR